MGRIGRGWELTKMSLRVIRKDKKLLVFPLISGLVLIAILASFVGFWFVSIGFDLSNLQFDWTFAAFWIAFYFVAFFVLIFFNVALVACAMRRLGGEEASFSYGIGFAKKRIWRIIEWSVFSATVGLVLRAISERAGFVGRIVIGLIGLTWSIATYFVVPVIAFEGLGPLAAMKRSVRVLKRTWGESLVSNLSLGAIFVLLGVAGIIPLLAAIFTGSFTIIVIVGVLVFVYWIVLALLSATASAILLTALYRYATTGKVSEEFPEGIIGNPWKA